MHKRGGLFLAGGMEPFPVSLPCLHMRDSKNTISDRNLENGPEIDYHFSKNLPRHLYLPEAEIGCINRGAYFMRRIIPYILAAMLF